MFKSYEEMDASHRAAYDLGRASAQDLLQAAHNDLGIESMRCERAEAELQAAQEWEKALREELVRLHGLFRASEEPTRKHQYVQDLERSEAIRAAKRTEEPSEDDEGLEPIETSPLTEREPDL